MEILQKEKITAIAKTSAMPRPSRSCQNVNSGVIEVSCMITLTQQYGVFLWLQWRANREKRQVMFDIGYKPNGTSIFSFTLRV